MYTGNPSYFSLCPPSIVSGLYSCRRIFLGSRPKHSPRRFQEALYVVQANLRARPIVRVDDNRRRQEVSADEGARPRTGVVAAQRLLSDLQDEVDNLDQLALKIAAVRIRLALAGIFAAWGLLLAVSTDHGRPLLAHAPSRGIVAYTIRLEWFSSWIEYMWAF